MHPIGKMVRETIVGEGSCVFDIIDIDGAGSLDDVGLVFSRLHPNLHT
jgi:hypothetical protein